MKLRRRARAFEALESRVLFTVTDYILDGSSLTTIVDGVSSTSAVADVNNVQINGDATLNHIIVQNFSGHATINGGGGGDQITVNGGGGGTVTVHDTAGSDQLVVRAPIAVVANVTVGTSSVTVGSDTVNYDSTVSSISVVGQLFTSGDTLTVNGGASAETIDVGPATVKVGTGPTIYYSTFTTLTVNGGGGDDTFNVNGNYIPTALTAGAGNATFNVNTNSVSLAITGGGSGTDTYNVNSNAGPLTITGQGADNVFVVNSSAASLVLNGGSAANTYTVNSNSASLTINGGATSNDVTVAANAGAVTVNGGTGTDTFAVQTTSGLVTLNGGAGANTTYDIAAPTIGPVKVVGNSGTGALTFHGTTLRDVFAVTATTLSAGTGATVTYSNLTQVTVDGVDGDDTFLVTSSSTPTTLLGRAGNNTFNIRANTALTTVVTGSGTNTINVGSNAPGLTGNVLAGVVGGVDVVGSGTDVLNLNDAGNASATVATLSTTGFTGIGGGITYAGLAALNVKMGSGGNTLNVTGSPASTATGVNLGAGVNSVLISSTAPASGGLTDDVLGALTLTGSGADDLVVDDAGNATPKTATLSATAISGMSPGVINYAGFDALTIELGTAGNDFTILNTNATTGTTVNGGAGNDTIRIVADAGVTAVTTGGGADVVAVRTINGATSVASAGGSTITVGTLAPAAGGVLAGVQGTLDITGGGDDALIFDNTGESAAASGTLSATALNGFGMAVTGVTYAGIGTLDVNLGDGGNTLAVSDTAAAATTNVNGGAGADVVTLTLVSGATNVATAGGDDAVNVRAINAATAVDTGTGADVVNVGSSATLGTGVVDGVAASLSVQGNGTAVLNVDDGGNAVGKTGALSSTNLTGVSAGTITYAGIATLNLTLGSGGDNLTVASTGAATNIDTGAGDDTATVQATSHVVTLATGAGSDLADVRGTGAGLTVNAGGDDDTIVAGSNGLGGGGVSGGIAGALTVDGGAGSNHFVVDDWGNASATAGTLTDTTLTGLNPGGITYSDITSLDISLGSADDAFTIRGTIAGSTHVETNAGSDTVDVYATAGDTTVSNDAGADTVNVGDPGPVPGHRVMDGVAGALHLTANLGATYTLNLLDDGSTSDKTASLAGGAATGLSPAAVDFAGVNDLNVVLGGGNNTVTISSPAAAVSTTLTTGAGSNTINVRSLDSATTLNLGAGGNAVNVGSLAPASNSTLDLINGALTIHGGGSDEVNLDDAGNSVAKTVTISATDVTGASPQAIAFDNLGVLRVKLGSGDDVATVADSSAFLTLNTGAGADQVNVVETTKDITVQTGSGVGDTVRIGSLAPAAGGVLADINGIVAVAGNGNDTLDVDDSGNAVASVGGLTGTALTGLSPAAIQYSGLAQMLVHLGSGDDTFNISGTAGGTSYTLTTGGGTNTVNAGAIGGLTTSTENMSGPVTLAGSGGDVLNVSDLGAAGARTGTLSATRVVLGGADVAYTGLATINLTLSPSVAFAVASTAAGVSNNIAGIGGTVTVGGAAAGNVTSGVAGPVSITGSNLTDVVVDDSGDATGRSVALTSSTVDGLSPATITYGGAKTLTVKTGAAADTVTVTSTHANLTTIQTNGGDDQVNLRATTGETDVFTGAGINSVVVSTLAPATSGGLTAAVAGTVVVTGIDGVTALTIDDSGDTAARTVQVGYVTVTGLNAGGIGLLGVASVTIRLGSGDDNVAVVGTNVPFTINAGGGNDAVTVTGPSVGGRLTLDGSAGTDALTVNGGGSGEVGLTPVAITGLPQQVDYASFATLNLNLAVSQSIAINELNPATVTTISNPSGQGSATFAGDFTGQVSISNFAAGTMTIGGDFKANVTLPGDLNGLSVAGDFDGALSVGGSVQSLTVGGDFDGGLSTGGDLQNLSVGGDLNSAITVGGAAGTVSVGGDLAGTFTVGGDLGTMTVGGDLAGTLSVGGRADSVTVGGDLVASGVINVAGKVGWLAIAGQDAGTITAGAVGLIGVGAAVPAAGNGALFTVTQGGVKRTIRATTSEGVAASGVTATVAYDGSTGSVPQAAIRLANANAGNRFDLILDAPANSAGFDLTRVKAAGDAYVGVRNVDVTGNLLNDGITAAQATYLGEFGDRSGGVYLPSDNLAAVAVTGNLALWSIRAKSVQAIAFATVTQKNGVVWKASRVADSKKWQDDILIGSLALNPETKQPYAKINKPTETLRVLAGTTLPVGLFVGKGGKYFAGHPSYFSDQHVDDQPPVAVEVTYLTKWPGQVPAIGTIHFIGDGGSVDTDELVVNISSTGPLGDVTLRAGKPEILQSLSAPSMFGQLTLLKGATIAKAAQKGLKAAQAAGPHTPAKPSKPAKPAKPAKPGKHAKPATHTKPVKHGANHK